jgi:predicted permease
MRQLTLAFRTLFRTPFVTIVAILSLALGIGANTAIFSLFHELIMRPLPVAAPGELVNLSAPGPKPGSTSCGQAGNCEQVFSYPMFRDLERAQDVFSGVAAHVLFGANFAYDGETINGLGLLVSGSYFPTLGLAPALGRLFAPADDHAIGEPHAVVLSHAYWARRFASSPHVLGQTIIVNGQSMTIIGVAPSGFDGTTTTLGNRPLVFVPITMRRVMQPTFDGFENRRNYWAYLFARLKPGVSIEQARASMNLKYQTIIQQVEAPLQENLSEQTMARFKARTLGVEPGGRGQSAVHREAWAPLTALLSLTAVVLLIACANVANLLLARAAGRTTEVAVRLAVGAGRRHLVGQLLLESCVLSGLGGLAGMVVAYATVSLLTSMMPAEAAANFGFHVNGAVLTFMAVVSIGTGVLFGLVPALQGTRPDLAAALRAQSGQPGGPRAAHRLRAALVTSQIALSVTLLIVAGLLAKSLSNVANVHLGLNPDHVLVFSVSPRLNGYAPERTARFMDQARDALGALPGVTGVTTSGVQLLAGNNWGTGVSVQGFDAGPDTDAGASANHIGPNFFRTLEGRVVAGREFRPADNLDAPKVVIVNEAFARKFNLGRDAVGKRMSLDRPAKELDLEIVGLVADMKYSEVKIEVPPQIYLPYWQDRFLGSAHFYVRSSGDPASLIPAVRDAIGRIDRHLPVVRIRPMPLHVQENVFEDRIVSTLSAAFAGLATLLASVGLYGVLSYTVSQRTREFGLRMALGAAPDRVRRHVLRQVLWMVGIGAAVGLALALGAGQFLASLLFQTEAYDAGIVAAAVLSIAVIAIGAGMMPAIRASRIDPMKALRYE